MKVHRRAAVAVTVLLAAPLALGGAAPVVSAAGGTAPGPSAAAAPPPAVSERPAARPVTRPAAHPAGGAGATAWPSNADGDRVADALAARARSKPRAWLPVVISTGRSAAAVRAAASRAGIALRKPRNVRGAGLVAATVRGTDVARLAAASGARLIESDVTLAGGPMPVRETRPAVTPAGRTVTPDHVEAFDIFMSQGVSDADPQLVTARAALGVTGDGDGDGYSTADAVVAVVDSGIDDRNEDLAHGKVLRHVDFTDRDASCGAGPDSTGAWDDLGHGTHVAGIVAGTGRRNLYATAEYEDPTTFMGVAPGAALLDLKVFDCRDGTATSTVDAALGWVLQHRDEFSIDVVNVSLGAVDAGADGTDSTSVLVNKLQAAGVRVVVAAGNGGGSRRTLGTPSSAEFATTVGAANAGVWGEWLAGFSSRGPTADGRAGVDVLAPGVNIRSTGGGVHGTGSLPTMSGTSMAAPYVAGLYALLGTLPGGHTAAPSGTACATGEDSADCRDGVLDATMSDPAQDLLRATAQPWSEPADTGAGMIRAARVLALAGGADPAAFAYPTATTSAPVTLSGERRVVVPVDTTGGPVGATVLTDVQLNWQELTLRWLDDAGDEVTQTRNYWGSQYFAVSDEGMASYQRTFGSHSVRGSGARYLEIRKNSPGPVSLTVTVTGPRVGRAVGSLHAHVVSGGVEGGSPATVEIVRDEATSTTTRFRLGGDPALASGAIVSVPPGAAGTSVTFAVPVTDDTTPDGTADRTLTLLPLDRTGPLLRVSVPVTDADPGTPARRRLLIGDAALDVFALASMRPFGDGVIGTAALPALTGSGYRLPFTAGYADPRARPVPLAADGGLITNAEADVLGAGADGSRILVGLWPAGSGALPGDTDNVYELFVHDMATGVNTRVGPDPADRAGVTWYGSLAARAARFSADGTQVVFPWPDAAGRGTELWHRDLSTGTLTRLDAGTGADAAIIGVTAGRAYVRSWNPPATLPGRARPGTVIGVDLATGEVTDLAVDAAGTEVSIGDTALSANGRWLVLSATDGARYRRDLTGGVITALPSTPGGRSGWVTGISDDGATVTLETQDYAGGSTTLGWRPADDTYAWGQTSSTRGLTRSVLTRDGVPFALSGEDPGMASGDTNAAADVVLLAGSPAAPVTPGAVTGATTTRTADGLRLAWTPARAAARYLVSYQLPGGRNEITVVRPAAQLPASASGPATVTPVSADGLHGPAQTLFWHTPSIPGLQVRTDAQGLVLTWDDDVHLSPVVFAAPCAGQTCGEAPGTPVYDTGAQVRSPLRVPLRPGTYRVLVARAFSGAKMWVRYPAPGTYPEVVVSAGEPGAAPQTDVITPDVPAQLGFGRSITLAASTLSGLGVSWELQSGQCSLLGDVLTSTGLSDPCTLAAATAGDDHWAPASATVTVQLTGAADTITVTAPDTLRYGDTAALEAATLSGSAVAWSTAGGCTLDEEPVRIRATTGVGSCVVTATTPGDDLYEPATVTVTVPLTRRAGALALTAPARLAYGGTARLTAASPGTGAVTWTARGGCRMATTSPPAVRATSGTGTCTVTATRSPDTAYAGATASRTVTLTAAVNPITVRRAGLLWTSGTAKLARNRTVTVTATAASGAKVTVTVSGPCRLSGSTVRASAAKGSCVLSFAVGAGANHAPGRTTRTIALTGSH